MENDIPEDVLFEDAEELGESTTPTNVETSKELSAELVKTLFVNNCEELDEVEVKIVNIEDLDDEDIYDDDGYDDDSKGFVYDESRNTVQKVSAQPNAQICGTSVRDSVTKFQPTANLSQKFHGRINVANNVSNKLSESERRIDSNRMRIKDKADRATTEQVLDKRTMNVLYKLMNRGRFDEINGCISTGKEANVYHAVKEDGQEFAIKVFKTSIMVFKNRDKYVQGDRRFRNGLAKNPRKKIETWSEKEMRNLIRMDAQGLNVPKVYEWRSHVLVMDFIGKNSWAAPKVKDIRLSEREWGRVYRDVVVMMWKLHRKCKLVHADLSEYNMLYYKHEVYVIDVSQAIDSNQRNSFTFLRKDIKNVTSFFRRKRVPTMTVMDLFFFIVDPTITEANLEKYLDELANKYSNRDGGYITPEEEAEENTFMEIAIAKSLVDIFDVEKEINQAKAGLRERMNMLVSVGLLEEHSIASPPTLAEKQEQEELDNKENVDLDDDSSDESEGTSSDSEKSKFINSARPKHETLEEKKARKKAVKDEKAERRKTKMKKHEKKSKVKGSRRK